MKKSVDRQNLINAVFGAIGDALAKGEAVQLIGFGTFGVKERAAREGRNPRTGEVVKIKASKVPTFKAGKALKDPLLFIEGNSSVKRNNPGDQSYLLLLPLSLNSHHIRLGLLLCGSV